MRLVFMGSSAFGCPTLGCLLADPALQVVGVWAPPPKPAGRGQRLQASPVQMLAEQHGVPVHTPQSLKTEQYIGPLRALAPDMIVVAAYGLILPPAVLSLPRYGCINLHASLLPRWRGASPIQQAIRHGDPVTGVCIMQMEEGLDTGGVYAAFPLAVAPHDTTATLHNRLAMLAARVFPPLVPLLPRITPAPQDPEGVVYAPRIRREDGTLDWNQPAAVLERHVRAFTPWPGAWTEAPPAGPQHPPRIIRVGSGSVTDETTPASPGTVLEGLSPEGGIRVACGQGTVLALLTLQRPDSRMMPARDFLNGCPVLPGSRLGVMPGSG